MGKDFLKNLLLTLRRNGQKVLLAIIAVFLITGFYLAYSRSKHQQSLTVPTNDVNLSQSTPTPTASPAKGQEHGGRAVSYRMIRHYRMYRVHGRHVYMSYRTYQRIYVVQKHDTLWKIAQKEYRGGSYWHLIYRSNIKTLRRNPNRIYPKMRLLLPARLSRRAMSRAFVPARKKLQYTY